MKHLKLILLFSIVMCAAVLHAQDFKKYDKGSFIDGKDSIFYRILLPENFDAKQKYPILFFLHGRGESGNDNAKQLINGGKLFLKPENRKQFPAIVVFPQCPENDFWANVKITADEHGKRGFDFQTGGKPTKVMKALLGMIDNFLDKAYVDKNRVYIGGLSMGGMGTFEVLRRKPKLFAAGFTICGADNIANVDRYKKVPLWIFQGGKDDVVNPEYSTAIANQMKIIGKEVKFTLYPDANHNSWDAAFGEPRFLQWLFAHQLKEK